MIEAFPLCWPEGWKRMPAAHRRRAQFSKGVRQYSSQPGGSSWMRKGDLSVSDATTRILQELGRFGVLERQDIVISTNVRLRIDGLPRSGEREPDDPGAAVYWDDPSAGHRCMAIDRYDRVADNLAAIAATLEAMRAIERHGGASILDRAFTGFTALPAPGQTAGGWREVFGFEAHEQPDRDEIEHKYRRLRSTHHPDNGGDAEKFHLVQTAYEQARKETGQ